MLHLSNICARIAEQTLWTVNCNVKVEVVRMLFRMMCYLIFHTVYWHFVWDKGDSSFSTFSISILTAPGNILMWTVLHTWTISRLWEIMRHSSLVLTVFHHTCNSTITAMIVMTRSLAWTNKEIQTCNPLGQRHTCAWQVIEGLTKESVVLFQIQPSLSELGWRMMLR